MDRLLARFDGALTLVARLFMALLFLMAGVDGIVHMEIFQAKLTGDGLPALIYAPVVWFLIIAALMLAFGLKTRWVALLMAGFSLASGLLDYTDFGQDTDMVMLLKNIALTGGYLFVALHGAGRLSVDAAMARHAARHG
ncbi:MAG: DoxX family protein [Maritimibacter sp.]|nr:DoxX family protein [Maritimibacter sp.]